MNFLDLPVPCKGVGFANVSDNSIHSGTFGRSGDIDYMVIGIIKHRTDKMIKSRIYSCKNCRGSLLYDICLYEKITALAYKKLSGFKHQSKFLPVFLANIIKTFGKAVPEGLNVGTGIIRFVGNLKSASKIDIFELCKFVGHFKENLSPSQKN